jgi:hypothetical protein
LGFIHYYFSPIKLINKIKLSDLTQEDTSYICNYIIEVLSQEYSVAYPKFEITNYREDEIDSVKYSNNRTLAFFSGDINKISLQFEVLIQEGSSLSDMIDCIAHEFQHYLDSLSFETSDQWFTAYKKNVDYYEYKANRFASKKLKKLVENMLLESI